MHRTRRTARLLTVAAGATLALGLTGFGAGSAQAFDFPGDISIPPVTFDPCLINPQACDPGPTVPDGPDDFTDQTDPTTPTTVVDPEPETPDAPVVPTAEPAPVVVAAPHFTG
jgi:hypothetical protein